MGVPGRLGAPGGRVRARPVTSPRPPGPVEVSAPAKLTLSLRITGVRHDGYHLLESEMVTVDLVDTLVITDGLGLTIAADPKGEGGDGRGWWTTPISAGADNLVARALAVVGRTARVHVVKRVPPGAGLGGGSADAAAILRWAGCTDTAVAAGLGADVPFCLAGGRALVRGVGDEVVALPYQQRRFVLLLLPFGVDTASVYRAWDRLAEGGRGAASRQPNELEAAALEVVPRLLPWRARFEDLTGRRPCLAGSGSTWYVEGGPEELGIGERRSLELNGETAELVPVTTTASSS
jgi:4-diphosphocytidyl-2-C-methyl-D-erythritol kinase